MVAVDLGVCASKAVHLERRSSGLVLRGFAVKDASALANSPTPEVLANQLKTLAQAVGVETKSLSLTVSAHESITRIVDTPLIPMEEFRSVLKLNPRQYLQQDLQDCVFDCHVLRYYTKDNSEAAGQAALKQAKQRVLIAGAKRQVVDRCVQAAKVAGLTATQVFPSLLGPINAFELAMPTEFAGESLAIIDIGFKSSSICILQKGELAFTRVVSIGGNRLTEALCESMKISYAEAEGIKLGMAAEVQGELETAVLPLGRELRASIDFFEHQTDTVVAQAFVSGGSASCPLLISLLENELRMDCKIWDPTTNLARDLTPQQTSELEQVAPQLAGAVGAALAAM